MIMKCSNCWYDHLKSSSKFCCDCETKNWVPNKWIPKGIPLEVLVPPKEEKEEERICENCFYENRSGVCLPCYNGSNWKVKQTEDEEEDICEDCRYENTIVGECDDCEDCYDGSNWSPIEVEYSSEECKLLNERIEKLEDELALAKNKLQRYSEAVDLINQVRVIKK